MIMADLEKQFDEAMLNFYRTAKLQAQLGDSRGAWWEW